MNTSITLTVGQIAREIADHMRLRKEGYYEQEQYGGILFGIECLVGKDVYGRALAMAKEMDGLS